MNSLDYEIYSGRVPSTYVYCVVCYRVIDSPISRMCCHVFTHCYTLDDDSERPMDYELSIPLKGFPHLARIGNM